MQLDEKHPANTAVLHALALSSSPDAVAFLHVEDFGDAYYGAGAHPDVVGRLWEQITDPVSPDMRGIIYRRPASVHERSGVVLGFCMGTQYALRIPVDKHERAIERGCHRTQEWGVKGSGDITDLAEFGDDWLFGAYLPEEVEWFRETHDTYA